MAIITCPECGKEISSTAKTCVHCGCKINVCPDCGTVYAGEKERCDNCGFVFDKKEENRPQQTVPQSAVGMNICERLIRKCEGTEKIVNILNVVIGLLGVGLMVWSFLACNNLIGFLNIDSFESFNQLLNLNSEVMKIKALAVVGLILMLSDLFVFDWVKYIMIQSCIAQLRSHKKDYVDFFCAESGAPEEGYIKQAVCHLEFPKRQKTATNINLCKAILTTVFNLALIILFVIWYFEMVDKIAHTILLSGEIEFEISEFFTSPLFIVGVIITVVDIVLGIILSRIKKKYVVSLDELIARLKQNQK